MATLRSLTFCLNKIFKYYFFCAIFHNMNSIGRVNNITIAIAEINMENIFQNVLYLFISRRKKSRDFLVFFENTKCSSRSFFYSFLSQKRDFSMSSFFEYCESISNKYCQISNYSKIKKLNFQNLEIFYEIQ